MDDDNATSDSVVETPVPAPEPVIAQPTGSTPADLPPEAPESPINDAASLLSTK